MPAGRLEARATHRTRPCWSGCGRRGRQQDKKWQKSHKMFYTPFSGSGALEMTQETVRIIAGILAVVLIVIIILRRRSKKKSSEDEF